MRVGPWLCALSVSIAMGAATAAAQEAAHEQTADPVAAPTNAVAEESPVTVEVYDVADLIVPHRPVGLSTTTLEEWSIGPREEIVTSLERLIQVLSLALDDAEEDDEMSRRSIVAYPDAMSLIVRQDAAGHRAIEDLLAQLRGGTEIVVQIEMLNTEEMSEADGLALAQALAKPLTADEVDELRRRIPPAVSSETCLEDGTTSLAGGVLGQFIRLTAAADATHENVRLWLDILCDEPDVNSERMTFCTYALRIPVGETTISLILIDGEQKVLLVTPTIRERPVRTAAAPK